MAEAWGPWQCQYQYKDWRGGVNAWVVAETDDAATVRVEGRYNSSYAHEVNYTFACTSCDGQSSGWVDTGWIRHGNAETTLVRRSQDFVVAKGKDARSVWCAGGVKIDSSYSPGASEAGVGVTIAARAYHPHGAPTLRSDKSRVALGETATLTWAMSATQGNATFVRFELLENGALVYSGSATSARRVPSQASGSSIGYELREVHEWYDTHPSTSAAVSISVARLAPPSAPSLTSPPSGSAVDSGGGAALAWRHNAVDGTAQSAAEIRASKDQRTWSTTTIKGSAQTLSLSLAPYAGGSVYWQVRTKGSHADWSPWSSVGYFRALPAPRVSLRMSDRLTSYPFDIAWDVADQSGSQASAKVVLSVGGSVAVTKTATTARSVALLASDAALADGERVSVALSVVSTTGLTGAATGSFAVSYLPPAAPAIAVSTDRSALAAVLRIDAGADPEAAPTSSIDVYRGDVALGSCERGGVIVDGLAPLDVPVAYRAVARALSGSSAASSVSATVRSRGCVAVNFGPDLADVAKLGLNGSPSLKIEREKDTFEAAAWSSPVAVYGTHSQASGSISGTVARGLERYGDLASVRRLMAWGRACVVRPPLTGEVYHADVTASIGDYGPTTASVDIDWEETAHDGDV